MLGEGVRLLLLSVVGWIRLRFAEFAIVTVAVIFFVAALILGSVAGHEALVPQVGSALATAIIAGAYLVLGGIAMGVWYGLRRRRRHVARGTNWAAAIPKASPALMLAALAAGAVLGTPTRRR